MVICFVDLVYCQFRHATQQDVHQHHTLTGNILCWVLTAVVARTLFFESRGIELGIKSGCVTHAMSCPVVIIDEFEL